jgi:hypothetical protein
MNDKKPPEWEELSKSELKDLKDELGITNKKDYNLFLRTLGTMDMEKKEGKSMGVAPPKPKPELPSIKSPPKEVSASKGKAITKKKKAKPNAVAVTLVIPTGKAKMAHGGMANNKSHMYSCGGMVHDKRKKK